jgi:rare lipoprotein A
MKHLIAFILFTFIMISQTFAATASWYGGNDGFHGRKTASGEIFNHNKLTAAHNSLPLGTYVCLTNVGNGKTVKVKINDRGGFAKYGRTFDVSREAAKQLDFVKKGTCKVTYRVCN